MGCDIHIFLEYKSKDPNSWRQEWTTLNYHSINPGRNYSFFTKLSGVRGDCSVPLAHMGWPETVSWAAQSENEIYLSDRKDIPQETLDRWVTDHGCKYRYHKDDVDKKGPPVAITHPDWHSHGWCNIETMSKALRKNSSPEYRAMLAAARSLEKDNMEVRFLFFYDN